MPLKKLGRPPFLSVNEVENDSLVEVVEPPYIVPADQSKWGRERGRAVVQLGDGEVRTWSMNTTTWDRLIDEFGDDPQHWVGRKVRIRKERQVVRGEEKSVLYGVPYEEPQQRLDPTPDKEIMARIAKLPPTQKKALLEALKEETA